MYDKRNNPVALAVGRAKLRAAMTDAKINLYLLEPGESCSGLIHGLADALGIVGCATELQCEQERIAKPPSLSVLRGALSACKALIATGKYDPDQTTAIVYGLYAAEDLNAKLKVQHILKAMDILKLTHYTNAPSCN